jgi:hypothetical protein
LDEAIPHFRQAAASATAEGNTALVESIHKQIEPYLPALFQPQIP